MISVEHANVAIGRTPIVTDVSFDAETGRVTTIIGPNGSGKTTLLRALSGDLPYRGSIRFHGREVRDLKAWQMAEMRGVLAQSTTLSFPFTVREVVRLGITSGRTGHPIDEADELADRALRLVDLDGFSSRFYQELSGGEQQRVQMARVLCQVFEPVIDGASRCLFLDEPVSNLDIRHQLAIMDIARDYAARGGTVIAVLHDLNLTSIYSDRVLAMHRGRCAGFGTAEAVLTDTLLRTVFECDLRVGVTPPDNAVFVLPQSASPGVHNAPGG